MSPEHRLQRRWVFACIDPVDPVVFAHSGGGGGGGGTQRHVRDCQPMLQEHARAANGAVWFWVWLPLGVGAHMSTCSQRLSGRRPQTAEHTAPSWSSRPRSCSRRSGRSLGCLGRSAWRSPSRASGCPQPAAGRAALQEPDPHRSGLPAGTQRLLSAQCSIGSNVESDARSHSKVRPFFGTRAMLRPVQQAHQREGFRPGRVPGPGLAARVLLTERAAHPHRALPGC